MILIQVNIMSTWTIIMALIQKDMLTALMKTLFSVEPGQHVRLELEIVSVNRPIASKARRLAGETSPPPGVHPLKRCSDYGLIFLLENTIVCNISPVCKSSLFFFLALLLETYLEMYFALECLYSSVSVIISCPLTYPTVLVVPKTISKLKAMIMANM